MLLQLHSYGTPAAQIRYSSCTDTLLQLHSYVTPAAHMLLQLHSYGTPAAQIRCSSCTATLLQLHSYVTPAAQLCYSSCTAMVLQLHSYVTPAAQLCCSSCTAMLLQLLRLQSYTMSKQLVAGIVVISDRDTRTVDMCAVSSHRGVSAEGSCSEMVDLMLVACVLL